MVIFILLFVIAAVLWIARKDIVTLLHRKPSVRHRSVAIDPIPQDPPPYIFTFLVNDLSPEKAAHPYNAVFLRYRQDCLKALLRLQHEIVASKGEVYLNMKHVGFDMDLTIRLVGMEESLQTRIVQALPRIMDKDYDPNRSAFRLGPKGGVYSTSLTGKRTYLKR